MEIDTSFTDILGNLKFAAFMAAEARHDRFVMLGDIIYLSGLAPALPALLDLVDVDVDMKSFIGTLVAGYRVIEQGPLFLDLFAGGRLTSLDLGIDLTGPAQSIERDKSKSSLAPVAGARFRTPLGGHWGLAIYGDLAGFGVTSQQDLAVGGHGPVPTLAIHWRLRRRLSPCLGEFRQEQLPIPIWR